MRLFVAIAPPASALDEVEARLAGLRPAWPQLRWTSRAAWHITLAFLGEVGEHAAGQLGGRLGRAASRHPSLNLAINGAGAFPAAPRARVLWLGIEESGHGIAALAASVAAGARRAGAAPPDEGRPYRPHLTLARCRVPVDVRPLVAAIGGLAGPSWTATEIHLIRSYLGSEQRYEVLGTWPLRTAG